MSELPQTAPAVTRGEAANELLTQRLHRPQATVLAIIDMQYASACRTTGLGRLLADAGRAEEGRYRFDRLEELVVPNIVRLLSFFRQHGLPRVFVCLAPRTQGCRDLSSHRRDLSLDLVKDSEYTILEALAPQAGEPVLTKLSANAFNSSSIDALLRNLDAELIVFSGVSTSHCVDLTARDAADRGYHAVIVEDAVAEDSHDFHASTIEHFQHFFGRAVLTREVLEELRAALARPDGEPSEGATKASGDCSENPALDPLEPSRVT